MDAVRGFGAVDFFAAAFFLGLISPVLGSMTSTGAYATGSSTTGSSSVM